MSDRGRDDSRPPARDPLRVGWQIQAESALAKVAAALASAEVPVVPVKGVVLAHWLYERPWERLYADVDLLVTRAAFPRALAAVRGAGLPIVQHSAATGHSAALVDGVHVELLAEIGAPDLTRASVADFLARARPDRTTFPFPILRIDDVDHFVLQVVNVVKDGFDATQGPRAEDLRRLLARLSGREDEVVARAREVGFAGGMWNVARWLDEVHGAPGARALASRLGDPGRPLHAAAMRALWRRAPHPWVGIAVVSLAPDERAARARVVARVVRRRLARWVGRDPDADDAA